jgi:hypothetical protein
MSDMSVNVNVHHPVVQSGRFGVYRCGVDDQMVINLNDRQSMAGTVTLFASDDEWLAIAGAVEAFLTSERSAPPIDAIHEIDVADVEREEFSRYVPCGYCGKPDVAIDQIGSVCGDCYRELTSE